MKNDSTTARTLKQIVTKLTESFMPLTQERHSFIVNHVSPKVMHGNDENLLSLTLGTLLQNVIMLSREQCIQVHSTLSGDCTYIQVHCVDPKFYNTLQVKNSSLQLAAEKMGGCISMSYDSAAGTTIAFSVANQRKVA
ncbi:MAG: hypothetical protein H7Y31_13430 [Chitinophagaceae bacterium]|nr:hypothetical protein [Chitinophagaceae bacterium]